MAPTASLPLPGQLAATGPLILSPEDIGVTVSLQTNSNFSGHHKDDDVRIDARVCPCVGNYCNVCPPNKDCVPPELVIQEFAPLDKDGLGQQYNKEDLDPRYCDMQITTAMLAPGRRDGCPRPDARACTPFHAPHVEAHSAANLTSIEKRGRGQRPPAPLVRMPNQRQEEEETQRRGNRRWRGRCKTQSTFETSRCNTCNISLKIDETLGTCI